MKREWCVYFIIDSAGSRVKVGYTSDINTRLQQLQTGSPKILKVRRTFKCLSEKHAKDLEHSLHQLFKKRGAHKLNEWFDYQKVNAIYKKYAGAVHKMLWDADLKSGSSRSEAP